MKANRILMTMVGAAVMASLTVPAGAAYDMFLQIEGIPGGSDDEHHKDWIEVSRFGVSIERGWNGISDPTRQRRAAQFSTFRFEGPVDRASPKIFENVCTAYHVSSVGLEICRSDGDRPVQAEWLLSDVVFVEYETEGASGGDGVLMNTYAAAFNEITYRYNVLGPSGKPAGRVEAHWNLGEGTMTMSSSGSVDGFEFYTGELVPEPGTVALLVAGGALALVRRRSGKAAR